MVVSMFPQLRSRTAVTILITLLLHGAVVLMALYYKPEKPPVRERLSEHNPDAMTVQLRPLSSPVAKPAPAPVPARPPVAQAKPVPKVEPKPVKPRSTPKVAQREAPRRPPERVVQVPQAPRPAPAAPAEAQPTDMMSMINAARERRRAAGIPSESAPPAERAEPAPAGNGDSKPASNDVALANIQHSMRNQGGSRRNAAGGAFQIVHKGPRQATYIFRGWASNRSANMNQSIDVDAGPNGDVETAIVRSMIELIRKYQPGDFTWDSYRLGRVLTLSSRPEDSAQLELFLKKEFFAGY